MRHGTSFLSQIVTLTSSSMWRGPERHVDKESEWVYEDQAACFSRLILAHLAR
jgi:hypothetical protein